MARFQNGTASDNPENVVLHRELLDKDNLLEKKLNDFKAPLP